MKQISQLLTKIVKSRLFWIPVAVFIALVLYRFKGYFVAATVNSQPITRIAVLTQLEKEGGKSILDNLITNSLIEQEAGKEKVTVTSAEIQSQIDQITANLKSSGQDLNSALVAQGMTRADLDDQIKLQILVQKMAGKDVTVTDADAQAYFNQNKSSYPKDTKFESVKADIVKTLHDQKLNDTIQTWIANLKSKAKINYFVNY